MKNLKETWPTYLISIIGSLTLFFFVIVNVRMAEINKDISFLNTRLDENTRKIEKISDELAALRENFASLRENMALFQSDLKSLDSRFALFIELFRQGGNNMVLDKN
jgi:chromosome segregation ATPase